MQGLYDLHQNRTTSYLHVHRLWCRFCGFLWAVNNLKPKSISIYSPKVISNLLLTVTSRTIPILILCVEHDVTDSLTTFKTTKEYCILYALSYKEVFFTSERFNLCEFCGFLINRTMIKKTSVKIGINIRIHLRIHHHIHLHNHHHIHHRSRILLRIRLRIRHRSP